MITNVLGRTLLSEALLAVALLTACHVSSSSPKYKYLQHGQTQIRIDERSGRTDRLTNNGWVPISFDSPSVDVPKEQLKRVSATIVAQVADHQYSDLPAGATLVFDPIAGPLCYTVDNDSDFVLKEIWVELPVSKSRRPHTKKAEGELPLLLPLSSRTGGFAPVGNKFVMCYDRRDDFSGWDALSASVNSAQGWKQ